MARTLWKDRIGTRFGRLTVLSIPEKMRVECRCDCGVVKVFWRQNLMTGHVRSCGCATAERVATRAEHKRALDAAYKLKKLSGVLFAGKTQADAIYDHLGARSMMTADLAEELGVPAKTVSAILCALEAKGRVRRKSLREEWTASGARAILWEQA